MQAKDVMTANVVSVGVNAPIHEVVDRLLKYRISAVPVVAGDGHVVGIVSEGDLLRPEAADAGAGRSWWLTELLAGASADYEKARGRTAGAVMTREVASVAEDTPLNDIAALLERRHIKRVPVLRDGRLVGIVSRANLLHGLAHTIVERHEPGAAKDRQLHDELVQALLDKSELGSVLVNVTVSDGHVRLWGIVDDPAQAALAESAAKSLPGVASVENNLGPGPASGVPI